jgi:flavin reductase (DIM6/NTAB) family NADH-FMN oxidoreductase RutF/DNA-binding IclR family transcriptional regulator
VNPDADQLDRIDPLTYRRVLGQYPTGVCVITAESPEHGKCGMVVGSFTSVSLDPPLIAFYPALTSTSWPKIQSAESFCVNILSADQEDVCRTFFGSSGDKFASLETSPAGSGAPVIEGVVAWLDCDIAEVQEAGDHYMVLGRVRSLETAARHLPLVFFQAGYGAFSPLSLAAPDQRGSLTTPLRHVDLARTLMERFAEEFDCQCIAMSRIEDEVICVASAGQSQDNGDIATLVGHRMPYTPPLGSVWAAFEDQDHIDAWLRLQPNEELRERNRLGLQAVRERGVSLTLLSEAQREFVTTMDTMAKAPEGPARPLRSILQNLSFDPPELTSETKDSVRQISAPVFDRDGRVAFVLTAFGFGRPRAGIEGLTAGLLDMAAAATRRIGGNAPQPQRERQ